MPKEKKPKTIFRIVFFNDETIYEIYARSIHEGEIFGFVIAEDFVFGSNSSIVVDPGQEKLRQEFSDVERTYIPSQAIIRIDEVKKEGVAKISDAKRFTNNKVSAFPMPRPIDRD